MDGLQTVVENWQKRTKVCQGECVYGCREINKTTCELLSTGGGREEDIFFKQ